ncbi:hypothetical protein BASA50_001362 [Batrachochytrium salamandrivorans]|uniref:Tubby C-terminal domain-containing protein n=1 Tax=Batrachochytrium salamandrivorans TaxID=1357716 RepID=A0ABQ8EVD8_9FUNG|nr:hypothetical protein BASA60_009177 [Batrachochytrium salamandrivorans]KAH6572286.1 hypothetical protein BASA62_003500 [Batrachochytrium salamandrivorans]KAH6583596.1 hypothetical protein BASA61_007927 [Batrachochytrium salamandrivorans]KAH6587229.1 hypothetical protein BASA50_001362 [Batrachochytrium salamandrivorans]KAH9273557.1 hypothetical protein BASA83_004225 [Batrachochytrium salamandrivorans]
MSDDSEAETGSDADHGRTMRRDVSVDQMDAEIREAMVSPARTEHMDLQLLPGVSDVRRPGRFTGLYPISAREELLRALCSPVPQGTRKLCRIVRRRDGVAGGNHTYEVFLEENNAVIPALFAKKMRSQTSCYIITLPGEGERGVRDKAIAKVRSNFLGTGFTIFDNGLPPSKTPKPGALVDTRRELTAVVYEHNFLGHRGPRRMTIISPPVTLDGVPIVIKPQEEKETLLERHQSMNDRDLIIMHNKSPKWSDDTQSFVLDFNQRVTIASVKNFQIVHDHDLEHIAIQFGKVSDDTFTMDVQYPFSLAIAFGVVLTSFDAKLACE